MQTLIRWEGGDLFYYAIPAHHEVRPDERVPWIVLRQAPVALRLPPEKYIFPKLD